MSCVSTWMSLGDVMLSGISQTKDQALHESTNMRSLEASNSGKPEVEGCFPETGGGQVETVI